MALMFVNGESFPSKSGQTYEVKNPATGEVVDTVPKGTAEDVQAAVDAAASEATAYQRQLAAAEDAGILAKLDPAKNEVITLTDAERGAFMKAVEPVVDKYRKLLGPKLFAFLEKA